MTEQRQPGSAIRIVQINPSPDDVLETSREYKPPDTSILRTVFDMYKVPEQNIYASSIVSHPLHTYLVVPEISSIH
ncbi:hypothetical protein SAMN05421755_101036 [Nitrosomonas sp. Nm33]|nr:hypothetical protein SAMN05421755_101036 [Nitrosomonas sp. Nm33]